MSYPRKRTVALLDSNIANYDHRKRRCDGRKPICGNCAEAEADCHYQELPIQRLLSGNIPSAMAKRLERIENLLEIHSDAIASLRSSTNFNCATTPSAAAHPPPINALDQNHDDIEHDIPAVLTYLATSGQHHNNNHNRNLRPISAPAAGGVRKNGCCKSSQHSVTSDRLHDRKISHVPSPPNSTSSAASSAASVTESSPKLATATSSNLGQPAALPEVFKPKASASSLLSFPTLKSLLGEFPEDYLFRIELQRASSSTVPVQPVELPSLNRDVTDLLVTTFFSVVHPCHPLFVRREMFFQTYEKVITRGLEYDAESALCLVVFALGVVASSPSVPNLGATASGSVRRDTRKGLLGARNNDNSGTEYFLPAQQIMILLDGLTLTGDLTLSQALIYGSIYLSFVEQPLNSWKLVHQAGKQLQLLDMHRK
ncbi:hypothetical protein KEM54_001069 [Ascosphaera aggregata]|nr:hypothetical protein KEM54_001069 [Ascosphaera aggregata]